MVETAGTVVEIKPEPEIDGSHIIKVQDFGGEPFDVLISPSDVLVLLETLQSGAIDRHVTGRNPHFPQLDVTSIGLAHQGKKTALMVSTVQIGTLALIVPDHLLRTLKSEIERALTFLSGPEAIN